MPTYPLPTLACQVTTSGISAPTYSDILLSLQASFQSIYGSDTYLSSDSQDGQFLAVMAQAINDANQACIAAYNNFSPATAQGAGLSSVVKINGLTRGVATNSQVDLVLTGTAGTVVVNGQAADVNGNIWNLPASVTIGAGSTVTVTATADAVGAISAAAGSVTVIRTPTLGWVAVTNPAAATLGEPVETDPVLRARQTKSVALPALTVLDSVAAALQALPGVLALNVVDNDTNSVNADGVPAHFVSFVVKGGDATQIATTILNKKCPGAGTYGTTTVSVTDPFGEIYAINFFRPTLRTITVNITIKALTGFVTQTGDLVKQAVVDYINALGIGDDVLLTRLYLPAQLYGTDPTSPSFEVTSMAIAISPATPATADITIPFKEQAVTTLANINLTVV